MHIINNPFYFIFLEIPEWMFVRTVEIIEDSMIIGIYGFADLILFFIQSLVDVIIFDIKEPFYMLGVMDSPSKDFVDVDYFTLSYIKDQMDW